MSAAPPKRSTELESAVQEDVLYRQRDDAKKRAVLQGGSYEDFQNMVSVAHLRPINDTESTRKNTAGMPAFTRDASGQRVRLDDDAAATARAAAGIAGTVSGSGCNDGTQSAARPGPPDSSAAFERHWRRQCAIDALKYQYVLSLPPSCIESIFKVEMSSVLLAESIVACRNELSRRLDTHDVDTTMPPANPESTLTLSSGGGVDDAERRLVADVLLAMSRTGRFNLNSKLIGRRAKDALRELIDTILAPGLADETASTLRATFAL